MKIFEPRRSGGNQGVMQPTAVLSSLCWDDVVSFWEPLDMEWRLSKYQTQSKLIASLSFSASLLLSVSV